VAPRGSVTTMAAIYQRARPTRFDEVVGQDHVKDVLAAAVRRGAVGHAYLFSGPRGVGKTTTARLLAMAVNCEVDDGEQRPCGRCGSCRLVQEGSHPDVTELDAASNNSVDDVRELREKVRLSPMRGRTRVWVLDEAHMLSRAAANALLKTLEEPPPGLLFVLATTEPEKLPPTVLSRCQHFRFRRLSDAEIHGKLERLLHAAAVEADPEALALVARSADGAMRDAESLLERLLAVGGPVTREAAEDALGLPPHERLVELAQALAHDDLDALLAGAALLYRDGFAPRTIAERLARTLRDALVAVVRGAGEPQLDVDAPALVRALHALDDAEDRFTRHGDLYALEITLIRALAALAGTVTGPARLGDAAGAGAVVTAATPVERTPVTTARAPATPEPTSSRPAPTPPDASKGAKPRMNIQKLMKEAQKAQRQMAEAQERLAQR
jgi:DNA polymerase III subunit gamma/tau